MKQLVLAVVNALAIITLSGCSNSSAATLQNEPTRPRATASLAPQTDFSAENPVKIPEIRRAVTPAGQPPVASANKEKVKQPNDTVVQTVMIEQDRKQERGNRRNGTREESKTSDSQEREGKKQRTEKLQMTDQQPSEEGKSGSELNKPLVPIQANESQVTPSSDSGSSTQATKPSSPVAQGSGSSSSSTPVPSSFTVTYGSSSSGTTRTFKKPVLPSNVPSWFTENDKDSDGQLTMNEWPLDRFEEFNKYDKNGDGIITIEEAMRTVPKTVAAAPVASTQSPSPATSTASSTSAAAPASTTAAVAPPKPPVSVGFGGTPPATSAGGTPMSEEDAKRSVERIFGFIDTNKDGVLDEKEIENTRSIKSVDWKKYDTNRDGKLDKNEVIALYRAEGNNMQRGFGGGGGGPGGWGSMSPDDRAKMMFDNMDKAKTGKISKEQFPGFWRDRFAEFDTNKDGFVDLAEFKTSFSKMMPTRGGQGGSGGGRGGDRGFGGDGGGRGFGGDGGGGRGGRGGFGGGPGGFRGPGGN